VYLKASEIQYEMKLVTPHFRAWRGTGSRSLFVLFNISFETSSFNSFQDSPSRISLCESRFSLLHLDCKVGFLDERHLSSRAVCRGTTNCSGPETNSLVHANGHTRLFIPAQSATRQEIIIYDPHICGRVRVEISLTTCGVESPP
jgi:hypothetical protein